MAGVLNQRNISRKGLKTVFSFVFSNVGANIPIELVDEIYEYLHPKIPVPLLTAPNPTYYRIAHPALQPPSNGRCMIEKLPTELRRKLLAYFLPDKDVTIRPLCQQHAPKKDPKRRPQRNTVSDLMLLSKSFKEDVTRCVYSERFFGIHVHEGIHHGGIEFLDTGRQPLHYKSSISDTRFERFDNREFGFNRLKKIEITIHPSTEDGRHSAMTTYYINHALVRMLERSGENDRIVSITIKFAQSAPDLAQASHTRRQISQIEHPWWNLDSNQPRSTSIHGISDVELALRPFAMLTTVHDVRIYLPTKVKNHDATKSFTANLEQSMKSNTVLGTLGSNDKLDCYAEIMRDDIESFIFHNKYGQKDDEIPNLTEEEYYEDEIARAALDEQENKNDSNEVIFMGSRKIHPFEIDLEDDDEDEDEKEEESDLFVGPGRTLARYDPNRYKKQAPSSYIERTVKSNVTIRKSNGETRSRVSFVDNKRAIQRGVSDLEVNNLDIADMENAGKTTRRHTGDSPGRSRTKNDGGLVDSGNKALGSKPLDLASFARQREARKVTRPRTSTWE